MVFQDSMVLLLEGITDYHTACNSLSLLIPQRFALITSPPFDIHMYDNNAARHGKKEQV